MEAHSDKGTSLKVVVLGVLPYGKWISPTLVKFSIGSPEYHCLPSCPMESPHT
ncbi:hypothetical protein I79_015282 [Cricetulus griseus]|uniref:Uncharacterized protein n=1 Tax=Cricetulus griseus TaxID=10029 RepID=G3HWC6_CRIGR|nr:hypothetical protein I79_015282 [Cricetulus griseus]